MAQAVKLEPGDGLGESVVHLLAVKKKKKSDLDRRRLGAKFVALRMRMLFCCGDNERERDVKRKSPVC